MSTEERDVIELATTDEAPPATSPPPTWRRGRVLGIAIAAVVAVEVAKDATFFLALQGWLPAWQLLFNGVLVCLPFLLAKVAPESAGFDHRWLPKSWWHWLWFIGMLFLAMVAMGLLLTSATKLEIHRTVSFWWLLNASPLTPTGIVLVGIVAIVCAPIAEEIFFRGYLLDQFQKCTRTSIALVLQALLFGFVHVYTREWYTSYAWFVMTYTFAAGLIFGLWRIKLKSLVPIILTHVVLNIPYTVSLKDQYEVAAARNHPILHSISKETTFTISTASATTARTTAPGVL